MRVALTSVVLFLGCGVSSGQDGGTDAGFIPTQRHALGLNDVTFLLPLEPLDAGSAFGPAASWLPAAPLGRLAHGPPLVDVVVQRLRVVGLRFDVCDRATPTPCPTDSDGVWRVVLQPQFEGAPSVEDVAVHAFFPVPASEVARVVDELRWLAARAQTPRNAPLQVRTIFASDGEYRARLVSLVGQALRPERLFRMTLFGQETERSALAWVFRGEELSQGSFRPIVIPDILDTSQEVLFFAGDSYTVQPLADAPLGFTRSLMDTTFRLSGTDQQRQTISALFAVDNPRTNTSGTVQCVSCHVSTTVLAPRANDAGIDLTTVAGRYTSSDFDLTPLGSAELRGRTLRALGYLEQTPLVSQRVINESANVVSEIDQQFPPAP